MFACFNVAHFDTHTRFMFAICFGISHWILHVQCLHFSFFAPFPAFPSLESILRCIFSCKILTNPTLVNWWTKKQRRDGLNEINCLFFLDGLQKTKAFTWRFLIEQICLSFCLSVGWLYNVSLSLFTRLYHSEFCLFSIFNFFFSTFHNINKRFKKLSHFLLSSKFQLFLLPLLFSPSATLKSVILKKDF